MNVAGLTIAQVASETSATPQAVRSWIARGVKIKGERIRLASVRVGGRIRVTRESVDAFLRGCNPPAPAEAESAAELRRRCRSDKARLLEKLGVEP